MLLLASIILVVDGLLRWQSVSSPLAPTFALLLKSTMAGLIVGFGGAIWERICTATPSVFGSYCCEENRYRPTLIDVWILLSLIVLVVWCYAIKVFVLPSFFAMSGVYLALTRRHYWGREELGGQRD
jgi:hypothetical protein